jgi:hypothetical protein
MGSPEARSYHELPVRREDRGSDHWRNKMKTSILTLALGIVLASPLSAYAAERAYAPAHNHRMGDFWAVAPFGESFVAPNTGAEAKAHATLLRYEGLSRDPDACVKYSCLGF